MVVSWAGRPRNGLASRNDLSHVRRNVSGARDGEKQELPSGEPADPVRRKARVCRSEFGRSSWKKQPLSLGSLKRGIVVIRGHRVMVTGFAGGFAGLRLADEVAVDQVCGEERSSLGWG
jgi:hypothetical protein